MKKSCDERTIFRKFVFMGVCAGIFAAATIVAYGIAANVFTQRSATTSINIKKGHTTNISFTVPTEGGLIVPGESKTIEAQMKNESKTDPVYVFVELKYSHEAWSIDTQWERVVEGADVYAYASNGIMTPIECGEGLSFNATMKVEAEGTLYRSLTNEDFKIELTGYAINSRASRTGVVDAYVDFESGGNAEIIGALED